MSDKDKGIGDLHPAECMHHKIIRVNGTDVYRCDRCHKRINIEVD